MGWSIGFDTNWNRDIGYGVPCECDSPKCRAQIDRGISYVCGGDIYGGDNGCGLFFCGRHLLMTDRGFLCSRCANRRDPYKPKPDIKEWLDFKAVDPSWAEWRKAKMVRGTCRHLKIRRDRI